MLIWTSFLDFLQAQTQAEMSFYLPFLQYEPFIVLAHCAGKDEED